LKSGRKRREEIRERRAKRAEREKGRNMTGGIAAPTPPADVVPVDASQLAPNNSYGVPEFVGRGFYVDEPFRCVDCGRDEVWTAAQQKWWYEVARGFVYSRSSRCRECRRRERERRAEARRVHLEGIATKRSPVE
jgi:hypothetical protein